MGPIRVVDGRELLGADKKEVIQPGRKALLKSIGPMPRGATMKE
jgi:hypothetical protein